MHTPFTKTFSDSHYKHISLFSIFISSGFVLGASLVYVIRKPHLIQCGSISLQGKHYGGGGYIAITTSPYNL